MVICPNRQLLGDLNPLLAQFMPGVTPTTVTGYPFRDDLAAHLSQRPNLLILDVTEDRDRAQDLLNAMQTGAPQVPVMALIRDSDPDYILKCLRMGASEFLVAPITAEQLQNALQRLGRKANEFAVNTDSRLFCIMPAKGACGASTIASTLAYQWKKGNQKRFLLADLDPLSGTLSFLLKMKTQYSFLDVLSRADGLDADLWRGLVTNRQGIDVLLSPEDPLQGLDQLRDPSQITDYARSAYDFAFFDAGGVYGDWNLGIARASDDVLLVTTNELPALQAAQRALQYLERNRISRSKIRLVVNRYARDLGLSKEIIGTALNIEVHHTIPSDYDAIQKSLLEGKPIQSSSNFGKAMADLAEGLGSRNEAGGNEKAPKKSGGFFSFLRR